MKHRRNFYKKILLAPIRVCARLTLCSAQSGNFLGGGVRNLHWQPCCKSNGLRSKRSKEEEKREITPVRAATTFCLPMGSARTLLGPISSTYCILLLLFRTQRLIDRYCGSTGSFFTPVKSNLLQARTYIYFKRKQLV
jgi:hypothetical protein